MEEPCYLADCHLHTLMGANLSSQPGPQQLKQEKLILPHRTDLLGKTFTILYLVVVMLVIWKEVWKSNVGLMKSCAGMPIERERDARA